MTGDSQDFDALDPALEAALARDGVSMVQLARLTDLDYRTIRRWTEGHQVVADFIAGRARAVAVEGGPPGSEARRAWVLERLADRGIPPVEVARAADAVEAAMFTAINSVKQAIGLLRHSADDFQRKSKTEGLNAEPPGSTTGRMNATLIRSTADDLRRKHRGRMVYFAQRVQPGFEARVNAAAKAWGVKPADVLRALVECALPEPEEQGS